MSELVYPQYIKERNKKYIPRHVLYFIIRWISDAVATQFSHIMFDANSTKKWKRNGRAVVSEVPSAWYRFADTRKWWSRRCLYVGTSFRVFCYKFISHSYFSNFILVCILISSALLAAEDPLRPNSSRNQVSSFAVRHTPEVQWRRHSVTKDRVKMRKSENSYAKSIRGIIH